MDSSGKLLRLSRKMLAVLVCTLFTASAGSAAHLTTFDVYAAMTAEERAAVVSRGMSVMFRQALEQGDTKRDQCMRETFLLKYGDDREVALAHARLRGRLDAAIDNPNPKGRVEYLVARHALETCPPTKKQTKAARP